MQRNVEVTLIPLEMQEGGVSNASARWNGTHGNGPDERRRQRVVQSPSCRDQITNWGLSHLCAFWWRYSLQVWNVASESLLWGVQSFSPSFLWPRQGPEETVVVKQRR
jgi:hypothetical protein